MPSLRALFILGRPQNALIPVATFLIGYIYPSPDTINGSLVWIVCLILFMLSMFATVQNDIEDYLIDKSNGRKSGLHEQGGINITQATVYQYILLFIALFGLVVLNNNVVSAVIALTFLLALAYNKPPFYFSRRPLLSIITMTLAVVTLPLILGLLSADAYIPTVGAVILVIAISTLRFGVIVLKDYKDVKGDSLHNKRTYLAKFGYPFTRNTAIILGVAGYIGVMLSMLFVLDMPLSLLFVLLYGSLGYRNISMRLALKPSKDTKNNSLFLKVIKHNYQLDLLILLTLILNNYWL